LGNLGGVIRRAVNQNGLKGFIRFLRLEGLKAGSDIFRRVIGGYDD
jgi:hypothetical protein